jgi:hypothetical protein
MSFENLKPQPVCSGCGKKPDELVEYIEAASEAGMTPEAYVRAEEGTYNPSNGHFLCTPCYCDAGMPSSPTGWVAP